MTRADLYDWVRAHSCHIEPLAEHKAKVIKVINPKNNRYAFLNLPIDERPVRDCTVYRICTLLSIPIPTHCLHLKSVDERIEDEDRNSSAKEH